MFRIDAGVAADASGPIDAHQAELEDRVIQDLDGDMRIQWLRVLLGGLLIEVVLLIVLTGGFAVAGVDLTKSITTASAVIIGIGCFVAAFLIVLGLGRGIQSHLAMHGFLMGLVATLIYGGLVAGSGQMSSALAAYGPATFVTVNASRLVGAVLGAVACERRKARNAVRPAAV